jgi:hypothetical protein
VYLSSQLKSSNRDSSHSHFNRRDGSPSEISMTTGEAGDESLENYDYFKFSHGWNDSRYRSIRTRENARDDRRGTTLYICRLEIVLTIKVVHEGNALRKGMPPGRGVCSNSRDSSVAQIRSGHWRSAVYLKRVKRRTTDYCWFCHIRRGETSSLAVFGFCLPAPDGKGGCSISWTC